MNANNAATHRTNSNRHLLFAFALAALASYRTMALYPAPVDLKSSAQFAILANYTITSTSGGDIYGDVGLSPGSGTSIVVAPEQVHGVIYAVDEDGPAGSVMDPDRLITAHNDLTAAYNDAKDRPPDPSGPFVDLNGANLGGLNLGPGLYKFTSSALISSNVTLTGGPDDVWIFQIGSTLTVDSGVKVILAGGAAARNIFWQVGTSATLGTYSDFKGTIMANDSITIDTGSTVEGRALARNAAVTFNGASINEVRASLAVISAVRSRVDGGVVVIEWDVELELDTVGYYLDRWNDGAWVRVNSDIIWSLPFLPAPKTYEQADPGAPLSGTVRYRIMELDSSGRMLAYGPYDLTIGGEISYEQWIAGIDWQGADSTRDADPDQDGASNFQEYLAGTDPLSVNSVLAVTSFEPAADGVLLKWSSEADKTYVIETTLTLNQPFLAVATGIAATPPENTHVLPVNFDTANTAFFRVRVGSAP